MRFRSEQKSGRVLVEMLDGGMRRRLSGRGRIPPFGIGRAKALAVLNTEGILAAAELSLTHAESAISADQVAVSQTLDGGWPTPPTKTALH
jgi:hypothetical protein